MPLWRVFAAPVGTGTIVALRGRLSGFYERRDGALERVSHKSKLCSREGFRVSLHLFNDCVS